MVLVCNGYYYYYLPTIYYFNKHTVAREQRVNLETRVSVKTLASKAVNSAERKPCARANLARGIIIFNTQLLI